MSRFALNAGAAFPREVEEKAVQLHAQLQRKLGRDLFPVDLDAKAAAQLQRERADIANDYRQAELGIEAELRPSLKPPSELPPSELELPPAERRATRPCVE